MDIKKSWLVQTPIAHRGLHNSKCPENSLAAFENAINNGFAIEIDVRDLDDGTIIVFHDEGLSRMTGNDGYVSNLKAEDLDNIFLNKTDQKIPTLEQTLAFVNGRAPLLIEIKNSNKVGKLEADIIAALESYKGEYAVQSFNPYSLEYFKKNAPHILRGQISCYYKKTNVGRLKRYFLKRLMLNKISGPDFISYEFINLPNRWVAKANLPTLAWTIRSNADYESVKGYCDNIVFEGFNPKTVE